MTHFECFKNHVTQFDLGKLFDGTPEIQKILDKSKDLFDPYTAVFFMQEPWIKGKWQESSDNGFQWKPAAAGSSVELTKTQARSVLDLEPMQLELNQPGKSIETVFKQLFTSANNHWHISERSGEGIKSLLGESDWSKISASPTVYVGKLNFALKIVADFDPVNNANTFWEHQCEKNKWHVSPDLSVPFHLVWPQYFPVWYRSMNDGCYSQIAGIEKLLDVISNKCGLNLKPLDLDGIYADYASAYRVLLLAYHHFISSPDAIRQIPNVPHFDFLTQLLAELDPQTEAVKQLLTRKALILYGTPGTGKTYSAEMEIAPAIAVKENIKVIQFHPGYSYADFIIGIRPKTNSVTVTYPVVPGILYRVAAEAANNEAAYLEAIEAKKTKDVQIEKEDSRNSSKDSEQSEDDPLKALRYVLIIDEINRADLSRVLGEVMYVLENRGDKHSVTLPNQLDNILPKVVVSIFEGKSPLTDPFEGGAKFYLPVNLFIIGTMNHVDRSISGIDMALRRRFAWMKHEFCAAKLRDILQARTKGRKFQISNIEEFVNRCQSLNDQIAWGGGTSEKQRGVLPFNQDHILGHTFFAEIVGIFEQDLPITPNATTSGLKISPHHLEKLWLYSLQPQLEDALGYEAGVYSNQMTALRVVFSKPL